MASLYDLETAIINANGEIIPLESEVFRSIRAALKLQWEDVVALLGKCRIFGCNVEHLRARHGSATYKDIVNFLKNMSSLCAECIITVEDLITNHERVILPYRKHEDNFKAQLEYPKVLIDPGYRSYNRSGDRREAHTGSHTQAGGRWTSLPPN